MVKILLCCAAGMSTSLLVENMKKAAAEKGIEAKIWAVSEQVVASQGDFDVLLLGPQIRYRLKAMEKEYGSKVPVAMIDMRMYGKMDGKGTLEFALGLLNK